MKFSKFFEDQNNKLSMGRLVTFSLIFVIIFEAIYSLIVLGIPWPLESNRLLIILASLGGKVSSLYLEKKNNL